MYKILEILKNIYDFNPIIPNPCQNERYLHHHFSREAQKLDKIKIIYNDLIQSSLHPEWPTYKGEEIKYAKYKNFGNKEYEIIDKIDEANKGSEGAIDFTVGTYNEPEIAIEFTAQYNLSSKDITYDIIKLLDSEIKCFKKCVSFNIVFREKELPGEYRKYKDRFIEAIKRTKNTAKDILLKHNRLSSVENRQYLIWIVEIAKDGEIKKRSWYLTDIYNDFKEGCPNIELYK
jgi:hypothetical protein